MVKTVGHANRSELFLKYRLRLIENAIKILNANGIVVVPEGTWITLHNDRQLVAFCEGTTDLIKLADSFLRYGLQSVTIAV